MVLLQLWFKRFRLKIKFIAQRSNNNSLIHGGVTMELVYKEFKEIPNGEHTGKIVRIEHKEVGEKKYLYTDIFIQFNDIPDREIKYGCPTNLSENSKLGKVLSAFTELKADEKYDVDTMLLNQPIEFMTLNRETKDGTFSDVVDGSIKPKKKEA